MDEPWFADRDRTRVVLIGAAHFESEQLPDIPAVSANLDALAASLSHPTLGMVRADRCTRLHDPAHAGQVGTAVGRAAREAEDLLLVYYSGHGVLSDRGVLHLALAGTDPEQPQWTGVSLPVLKEAIHGAGARARVLILDCCFSGQAASAMSPLDSVIAGQLPQSGTYVLTSTSATEISHALPGERLTAFTAALLDAMTARRARTLDEIYRHVERTLLARGLPGPRRLALDAAGTLVVCGAGPDEGEARTATVETKAPRTQARAVKAAPVVKAAPAGRRTEKTVEPPEFVFRRRKNRTHAALGYVLLSLVFATAMAVLGFGASHHWSDAGPVVMGSGFVFGVSGAFAALPQEELHVTTTGLTWLLCESTKRRRPLASMEIPWSAIEFAAILPNKVKTRGARFEWPLVVAYKPGVVPAEYQWIEGTRKLNSRSYLQPKAPEPFALVTTLSALDTTSTKLNTAIIAVGAGERCLDTGMLRADRAKLDLSLEALRGGSARPYGSGRPG